MTAKEYLLQYIDKQKDINCKNEELNKLLADATSITPSSSDTHTIGSISDKVGIKGAAIADIKREIEEEQKEALRVMQEIRTTIAAVPNGDLRRLLTYRYICNKTWEQVSAIMAMSYFHVATRLHSEALSEIEKILNKGYKML